MTGEWKQRWSDFGLFRKERLVRAKHDEQWTRLKCVYAHYRRWSFFRNERARSLEFVEGELLNASNGSVQEFRGHRLFPCWIVISNKQDDDGQQIASASDEVVYRGKVRTLYPLWYPDLTVPQGVEIDWIEPNSRERANMRDGRRREGRDPAPLPLVVFVGGARRYVDASKVEKLP